MATIILEYNARNSIANRMIDLIRTMDNVFTVKKPVTATRKTAIDEALEDVRRGRIYAANDAKSLIGQCLQ